MSDLKPGAPGDWGAVFEAGAKVDQRIESLERRVAQLEQQVAATRDSVRHVLRQELNPKTQRYEMKSMDRPHPGPPRTLGETLSCPVCAVTLGSSAQRVCDSPTCPVKAP